MNALFPSLLLALRDLADPAVLRVGVKCLLVSIALFVVLALAGGWAADHLLAQAGLANATFAGADALRALAATVLALLGLWLLWRVVAIAVVQFFADEVVLAVERRHYPAHAAAARDLSVAEQARAALASAGRALGWNLAALPVALVLIVTGIGPALVFFAVNAVLLGRELAEMVWLRHRAGPGDPLPGAGRGRLALGAVVTGLLAVPFANLVAPLLGASAATHMIHRQRG